MRIVRKRYNSDGYTHYIFFSHKKIGRANIYKNNFNHIGVNTLLFYPETVMNVI